MSSSTAEIYYLPSGCDCDGTNYSQSAIEAACQKALTLASEKKTEGKDKCMVFCFTFPPLFSSAITAHSTLFCMNLHELA
jgi:hypothetical protein